MITFGPVPSRRLGKSLGINNIPPKQCTYSCVYCQVGPTTGMGLQRCTYYKPRDILVAVRNHLDRAGTGIDYLSFVPDGEPTLDVNLGRAITLLKEFDIPVAVISNATLAWQKDVAEDLALADWVSLKVDSVDINTWKRINRPNRQLSLPIIMEGIRVFSRRYKGKLVTETMLVEGINDGEDALGRVARFIASINPSVAYLSIPTRPPLDKRVCPPDVATVNRAYQVFSKVLPRVECITGSEGEDFGYTGDLENDLLDITAVHPLRKEAAEELCRRNDAGWNRLEALVRDRKLAQVEYAGETYFIRQWKVERS